MLPSLAGSARFIREQAALLIPQSEQPSQIPGWNEELPDSHPSTMIRANSAHRKLAGQAARAAGVQEQAAAEHSCSQQATVPGEGGQGALGVAS